MSQQHLSPVSFSVEHVKPRQLGGASTEQNLALSCQECNNHKFTKIDVPDPLTGILVPLYHPRQQRWPDHFPWSDDSIRIIGISPTGRATIEALHLNRSSLVNPRHVLHSVGRHPPADALEEYCASCSRTCIMTTKRRAPASTLREVDAAQGKPTTPSACFALSRVATFPTAKPGVITDEGDFIGIDASQCGTARLC